MRSFLTRVVNAVADASCCTSTLGAAPLTEFNMRDAPSVTYGPGRQARGIRATEADGCPSKKPALPSPRTSGSHAW